MDQEAKFAGSAFKEFEVRAKTFENATATFNNRITALNWGVPLSMAGQRHRKTHGLTFVLTICP